MLFLIYLLTLLKNKTFDQLFPLFVVAIVVAVVSIDFFVDFNKNGTIDAYYIVVVVVAVVVAVAIDFFIDFISKNSTIDQLLPPFLSFLLLLLLLLLTF